METLTRSEYNLLIEGLKVDRWTKKGNKYYYYCVFGLWIAEPIRGNKAYKKAVVVKYYTPYVRVDKGNALFERYFHYLRGAKEFILWASQGLTEGHLSMYLDLQDDKSNLITEWIEK